MSHRRIPRAGASGSASAGSSSRDRHVTAGFYHSLDTMARDATFCGSLHQTPASPTPPPSPGAAFGGRSESRAGRRRYRGASAGQDSSASSVAATDGSYGSSRRGESGSEAASGSGPSFSGAGGSSLTERNVTRTSGYYEYLRSETDKADESDEVPGREDAILATLTEVGKKMSNGRK